MSTSTCINRVELQGLVGASKVIENGGLKSIRFTLATNSVSKDVYDRAVLETVWHSCVIDKGDKTDMSLFEPGTSLHVEGRIRSVRYVDNNGYERAIQEIVVSKAERTAASEVKP